jgi:serine protease Do
VAGGAAGLRSRCGLQRRSRLNLSGLRTVSNNPDKSWFHSPKTHFSRIWRLSTAALLLFATGCAHFRSSDRTFRAFETAARRAEAEARPHLVHFRVQQAAASSRADRRPSTITFSGIVLTAEGHLLAPFSIRNDTPDRIEAWIGDQQYLARPLKSDEQLGMSILRIQPREPLTPLRFDSAADLRTGEHAFVVISSDADNEFAVFTLSAFMQGVIDGRYRQFSLSPLPNQTRGAPVFSSRGELVGIMSQSNAWALTDLAEDLNQFLGEVTGRAETPARDENAWFGATLSPINADFARANKLSRSSLWLVHVFEDSPAHRAGFRSGDLVIELNGEPLRLSGSRAYQYFLQALRPRIGAPFEIKILRDGKLLTGKGVLDRRPEPQTLRAEDLGIHVTEIYEPLKLRHNLFETGGVMVTEVERGSPAATGRQFGRNLLMTRDVITALHHHPTPTLSAFNEALDLIRRERPGVVLVEFMRGPVNGFEALNLRIGEREEPPL